MGRNLMNHLTVAGPMKWRLYRKSSKTIMSSKKVAAQYMPEVLSQDDRFVPLQFTGFQDKEKTDLYGGDLLALAAKPELISKIIFNGSMWKIYRRNEAGAIKYWRLNAAAHTHIKVGNYLTDPEKFKD